MTTTHEQAARFYLWARFGGDPHCPTCRGRISRGANRNGELWQVKCSACRKAWSWATGTPLANSNFSPLGWLRAAANAREVAKRGQRVDGGDLTQANERGFRTRDMMQTYRRAERAFYAVLDDPSLSWLLLLPSDRPDANYHDFPARWRYKARVKTAGSGPRGRAARAIRHAAPARPAHPPRTVEDLKPLLSLYLSDACDDG